MRWVAGERAVLNGKKITIWIRPHADSPEFFFPELFTFIAVLGKCPYTLVADNPYIYCRYNTTLFVSKIMYHEPRENLPGSKIAHFPGKLHICQVFFETFAHNIAHFPGSKRAHLPGKLFFKLPKIAAKKGPIITKNCRKLPNRMGYSIEIYFFSWSHLSVARELVVSKKSNNCLWFILSLNK